MNVMNGETGSPEEGSTYFTLESGDRSLDTFGLQLVAQFMVAKAEHDNPGRNYIFRECVDVDDDGKESEMYELVEVGLEAADAQVVQIPAPSQQPPSEQLNAAG